ncbi:hypothetical protein [Nonomuraea fuscirosea]|uniref:hypothetical protein n=1 Tax=Nonomuraea fuscirosea TaxID=1291556 RepID=UPI0033D4B942
MTDSRAASAQPFNTYGLAIPGAVEVVVAWVDADRATIQLTRPLDGGFGRGRDRLKLPVTTEELWAIWALVSSALADSDGVPEWLPDGMIPARDPSSALLPPTDAAAQSR